MHTPRLILFAFLLAFILVDTADAQRVLHISVPQKGSVRQPPGGSFILCVPNRAYLMGSNSGDADEAPAHTVTLSPFNIWAVEALVQYYQEFCTNTGRSMPPAPGWGEWASQPNNPISNVTWYDAVEYCAYWGWRLPTEAEWEFAARGGSSSGGYLYSGSNNVDDVAWYIGDCGSPPRPHDYATKAANELGAYDMSGNVWEWCSDWYSSTYYSVSPVNDPTGPSGGSYKVVRGGSYGFGAWDCRSTNRNYASPGIFTAGTGIRMARDAIVPIELESLEATIIVGNYVKIQWKTRTEINNYGFEIQKTWTPPDNYQSIGNSFVPGHGTTIEPQVYEYTDRDTTNLALVSYRLKQIDLDGTIAYSDGIKPTHITSNPDLTSSPIEFSLAQNFPNPFNPSTTIRYGLPSRSHVTLSVFTPLGQQVALLQNGEQNAGYHEVQFNGTNLSSGVYYCRIQVRPLDSAIGRDSRSGAGDFVQTRKLMLVR